MKIWAQRATLLLALACAGCAGDPGSGSDHGVQKVGQATATSGAVLTFSKGYHSGLGVSGMQVYSVSETTQCEGLKSTGPLLWTTAATRTATAAGGKPIVILASTGWFVSRGVYQLDQLHCEKTAVFTPLEGHRYAVVSPAPTGGECQMQVADEATGQSPADLKVEDGAACLRAAQREEAARKAAAKASAKK